jgi:hypothetical protein
LAQAIIAQLPSDWDRVTLTVTESEDGASDAFGVEIRGPDGTRVERGRAVVRALLALVALLLGDGRRLAGLKMRLWRDDTWRFEWSE